MDELYLALGFTLLGAMLAFALGWLVLGRQPSHLVRTNEPVLKAVARPVGDVATRLVEAIVRETGVERALVAQTVAAVLARERIGNRPVDPAAQPPAGWRPDVIRAPAARLAPPLPPSVPVAPAAPAAAAATPAPLVLVVDDSITVRVFSQRLLQRAGYRVVLAEDGVEALERLKEERPRVVLADIEMPRMDGFDLARHIRSDGALANLPIIMITSRIAHKHREVARQLGVNHYLGKPYAPEELIQLVRLYATAGPVAAAA
ncbi:MAG: response regulator [Variovorax sp.]|nr:MAG: response regulator [Variovorax sp.]